MFSCNYLFSGVVEASEVWAGIVMQKVIAGREFKHAILQLVLSRPRGSRTYHLHFCLPFVKLGGM